ncbi:hypothetical protein MTO96_036840 [Rhipicephalus appendiculatus]
MLQKSVPRYTNIVATDKTAEETLKRPRRQCSRRRRHIDPRRRRDTDLCQGRAARVQTPAPTLCSESSSVTALGVTWLQRQFVSLDFFSMM